MKNLLLSLLFLSPVLCQAQRFQRYYQPPAGVSGSDVLTTGVDNAVITGGAAAGYFQPTSARSLRFVRFDDAGVALVNNRYDLRNNSAAAIEASFANSITSRVSGGVQSYTVTGQVGSSTVRDAFFARISTSGTASSVRRFSFGTGSVDEGTCIRPSTRYADNFYMCGNTTPANVVSAFSRNFFLICTNGSGAVQRGIVYSYSLTSATGLPLYTSASSLVEDSANNVVWVVGQAVANPTATGGGVKSGLLVKINGANGNLLSAWLYDLSTGTNGRVEGFKAIRKLSDQKYIVLGSMNILPAGGAGIGANLPGDVLIKFDLLTPSPTITWQKGYNFNTGTTGSIAPLSGKDVIEVRETSGSAYWVCGKYPQGNQKAIFRVDALGNHLGNSLYEAGRFGDLFAMAQTSDPIYPVDVLAFGTSPFGNFTRSYIMKALPSLATVTSPACPQRTLSKYEVGLNVTRTSATAVRATGTNAGMVATTSPFIADLCVFEPASGARESVEVEQNEEALSASATGAISLYPNPLTHEAEMHIAIRTEASEALAEVLDFTGRRIMQEKIRLESDSKDFSLPVSGLNPGQYLLRVSTQEGVRTHRFVKK